MYGWEEKKSKTSWGGQTVDYEKIATAAVEGMPRIQSAAGARKGFKSCLRRCAIQGRFRKNHRSDPNRTGESEG